MFETVPIKKNCLFVQHEDLRRPVYFLTYNPTVMHLSVIDILIIVVYLIASIMIGYWVSHRASASIRNYFLGGNQLPWYLLGVSNASGMFDIAGTMLLVYWLSVYGMKSMWIPWLWPVFNQIFLMVYLSSWLRRSNVMTGAEWIKTRFGTGKGANLSHIIVVIFAIVSVIGFLSYGFKGIGKFITAFLPPLVTDAAMLARYPQMNENLYALILMGITTFYVVKGGMFSVVITEVIQYCILTIASIAIGIIAIVKVSPGTINAVIPEGWKSMFFGKTVGLDWTQISAQASAKLHAFNDWIQNDGYYLFGIFFVMVLFKGILLAAAGPAPNYDMQRILSTRNPQEASKMSSLVNVVLNPFRYFMVAGLTVLALTNFDTLYTASITEPDFESILPQVLATYIPVGLLGFLMAGLLAAFMSNFAATVNAAPAYIVNDIYKKYINPHASEKTYVRMSYLASVAVVLVGVSIGFFVESINKIVLWIVAGLWGGYTASNVLKWYWWRFNGYGYFWGMVTGIAASLILPALSHLYPVSVLSNSPLPANFNMNAFPVIFFLSLIGCLLGTYLTRPEDDETLKHFYKNVRPWGFWKPIHQKVVAEDPSFVGNKNFLIDMFNIVVGIVWQITLMAFPVYLVLRDWKLFGVTFGIMVITSLILKKTWWDRLKYVD